MLESKLDTSAIYIVIISVIISVSSYKLLKISRPRIEVQVFNLTLKKKKSVNQCN